MKIIHNLENDLRNTDWVVEKVRSDTVYAQHMYAALCNNDFIKNEVWPRLTEEKWNCSWRYAGGIIAEICGKGDYMDWYCSGIGGGLGNGDEDGTLGYVEEALVTHEIQQDLLKLGWVVVLQPDILD